MSLKGVVQRIARVDLNKRKVKVEEPNDDIYINYLGGYGLGAYYLFTRQSAKADPLGPDNTLGLITGPLTGTQAITGNRFTVVGKSPKTGGWGDANCGGRFGPALKAFAIECYEKGIISKDDTGGIELTWGNHAAIVRVAEQMAKGEGFGGNVLGDGVKNAAEILGEAAKDFAMECGGEELPMHDPRCYPGLATGYIADATPARHTQYGSWSVEADFTPPGLEHPEIFSRYNYSAGSYGVIGIAGMKENRLTVQERCFDRSELRDMIARWVEPQEKWEKGSEIVIRVRRRYDEDRNFRAFQ